MVSPVKNVLAVAEELVQVPSRLEQLDSSLNELEEVSPGLVDAILPAGDLGGLAVALGDEGVAQFVGGVDAMLAELVGLAGEVGEPLAEQAAVFVVGTHLVAARNHRALRYPGLQRTG